MKLFHRDTLVGAISPPSQDGLWMCGRVELEPDLASIYREFFAFMIDEDKGLLDPPFDEELLNEEYWFIIDDEGRKRGIELPAVHEHDGYVMWLWR